MVTTADIINRIASQVRPWGDIEMTIAQMTLFVNQALEDAASSGWLIDIEDDESLTFSASTYEYSVPSSFAYIGSLRVENSSTSPSTWDERIPVPFWEIRFDTAAKFYINRAWPIPVGKKIKVIGQRRPILVTTISSTIEVGMEAFVRERAIAYALGFQSTGSAELSVDQSHIALMDRKMAHSERLLSLHPQEFRVTLNSEHVPGR